MIEFRITFGCDQPHGPSDEGKGKYTTIHAPTMNIAADMAMARYGPKWAHLYSPRFWGEWSRLMEGVEELEVLQYDPSRDLLRYPHRDDDFDGIVYGTERRAKSSPVARLA